MRGDSGQQAIFLILGIATIMFLFSLVLITTVSQQTPLVNSTLVSHDAYRAVQAGVNDFLYAVNQDPNAVACQNLAVPPATSPSTSCNYFTSRGVTLDSWQMIPNQPTRGGISNYNPTEWMSIGYPTPSVANQSVQVTVVGAAGFANASKSIQYQTANITVSATNDFLINVVFSNYNAIDTNTLNKALAPSKNGSGIKCNYLWQNHNNKLNNDPCANVAGGGSGRIALNFPMYGPLYSNDEILTSGCPKLDYLTTAAPQYTYPNSGCTPSKPSPPALQLGAVFQNTSKNQYSAPILTPPANLASSTNLKTLAELHGCYYIGPTTITLVGTNGYTVTSPDTTRGGSTGDSLSLNGNLSQCALSGKTNRLPDNGVIYVGTVPGQCTFRKSTNPLVSNYTNSNKYSGEGSNRGCEGDAIVHGSLSGSLTIAASNDVIIDGNITYLDCPQLTAPATGSANGLTYQQEMNAPDPLPWPVPCNINPSGTNDVLGLIANNFVELNYPSAHNFGDPQSPTCAALNCFVQNPIIMGSILSLQHTFAVPNYSNGPYLGMIDYYGSLAENFVDVEQSSQNNGYGMSYNWDTRLGVLSPPHYLTPGTSSWAIQSFSVTLGTCSSVWPVHKRTCPTAASAGSSVP